MKHQLRQCRSRSRADRPRVDLYGRLLASQDVRLIRMGSRPFPMDLAAGPDEAQGDGVEFLVPCEEFEPPLRDR